MNTPSNQQTADQVAELTHVGEIGGSGRYYDPAAFVQPTGVRVRQLGPQRGPSARAA